VQINFSFVVDNSFWINFRLLLGIVLKGTFSLLAVSLSDVPDTIIKDMILMSNGSIFLDILEYCPDESYSR
jgi:hypothetical protein